MTGRKRKSKPPLPSKPQILEFIRDSAGPVGKREIARAFHISGADRRWLNQLLRELPRPARSTPAAAAATGAPGAARCRRLRWSRSSVPTSMASSWRGR